MTLLVGPLTCKIVLKMTNDMSSEMLNPTVLYCTIWPWYDVVGFYSSIIWLSEMIVMLVMVMMIDDDNW